MKPDLTIVAEREIPKPPKRRELTRMEVIELSVRQEGKCGCGCGAKLDAMREGVIDEHVIALGYGREDANDLKNRALYRKPCAAKKTAEEDLPGIAKCKRLAEETGTGPKREIPTHVNAWGPKGVRKIQSRGFQKRPPSSPTPTHKEETLG
jgi:hypothetical protein